ncbi:nickel-dependent lactate racemase family protein [Mariniblastus fucicola]|uniref:LarA-like N-terminal domain-containing protein n=1 Tax=Mariniblastus fucicola TaxID=980251 RepID=A0A5B9PAZ7_9BACT|nr:hypothetical protein [Mariniblastus fucicola]QEG22150.1 hypothetical protein MFFC18_20110 [Mariniblastus fucicola]
MSIITQELFDFLPAFSDDGENSGQRDKIESLLKKALAEPVNYPSLSESIFPGDRVTILVQAGLPAAGETLDSLLSMLELSRIETADILVVVPQSMAKVFNLVENTPADPETRMPATYRRMSDTKATPLCFEIHVTDDEQAVSYLAANVQGNPVYVNRSLCDSDVILPLSCLTPGRKQTDCLYPEFSTDETRSRYRKKDDSLSERVAEAELANDSLGLFFSIELICSPGDVIEDIVCGSRTHARQIAAERLKPLWAMEQPDGCDVVVTTVESDADSTAWSSVIRAVNSASQAVADGPIIVWTELSEKPNAKVKAACSAQFEGSVPDSLSKKLQHFASILCERPVYLKSGLSQNVVESLGLGYIESAESAQRIIRPFSKPLLIRDGHLRA